MTEQQSSKKYRCTVCGYIHYGDIYELPDDWKCPVCDAPKDDFEEVID